MIVFCILGQEALKNTKEQRSSPFSTCDNLFLSDHKYCP